MKMHIGFLTTEYPSTGQPFGGIANYTQRVSRYLVQRGHTVSVIVLSQRTSQWIDQGVEIYEVENTIPLPIRALDRVSHMFKRHPFKHISPAWLQINAARIVEREVWRIHKRNPFDIIQTPNYKTPGLTLAGNKLIPIICRMSSYTPLWRASNNIKRTFADALTDWLEIKQLANSNKSYAPSKLLIEVMQRFESFSPALIRTPLDPDSIVVDTSYYDQHFRGKKYLLYFGSLRPMKGVDLLIDAISPILQLHPDLLTVFIGPDYGNAMHIYAAAKGDLHKVSTQIRFEDPLPKHLLFPIIQNALFVVLPSRVDNLPNTCLEAQRLGKIIIATQNSSLDEMIVDGETGFLARNGDVHSLKATIERALALSPEEKQVIEDNVLTHVKNIMIEDRVAILEQFYQDAVTEFKQNTL